ncbi:MAG: hypothetical protein D8M57_01815 [Candidatus Scalindua sp. AMX11]|nr:MAG: hypothetical protein DWQ00_15800 [Candidatus Scalindua sp.]NOG85125.1 hypothetical protein [Planctomycetota bacterium]RZV69293.1 MAG: hypothetical protein EX341_16010 [Candidatus Scalindua sp. SCAELEC01]TDE66796.1 MAG: hypothetical protein D8M57_01815 [Candidatus Scalindua sp. AMX11]GJQ60412.1 MAG: hypothetical protein SCALA701_32130 [Candidatus Scalindua sp.]
MVTIRENRRPKGAISHIDLDNKIAKIIYDKWPRFVTQKEIASELQLSQSLVSKRLASWKTKNNVPLKMFYEERNVTQEKYVSDNYHVNDVVVLKNTDYFINTKAYSKQIGKYASGILVRRINHILEKKSESVESKSGENDVTEETVIKISASGGSSVFSTVMSLAEELENSDINLVFSSCLALRSNSLIELSPLHIVSQLLNKNPNVEVAHTYQLPETSNLYTKESLYEIVEQRIRTQKMLGFDNEVLQSDIVIFGLGNIRWNFPVMGFMRHIYNLRLQSFIRNFGIMGEIAFAPFSKDGFLFHHLVSEVFEQENGEFRYGEFEQIKKLKKIALSNTNISKQDLVDAANFFSSIFTVNFCSIEKNLNKQKKRPYIILVVGGESQKAQPLKLMLDRWKKINFIDGLVTSENIAQNL